MQQGISQSTSIMLRAAQLASNASSEAGASLQMMLEWDGVLRADSPQATLFEFWLQDLLK